MIRTGTILCLAAALFVAAAPSFGQSEEQAIAKWLAGYDAALNARNLDRLATSRRHDHRRHGRERRVG